MNWVATRARRKLSQMIAGARGRALDVVDRLSGDGGWHARDVPPKAVDATGIAIVGCGFVADFYALNLRMHADLRIVGAFDQVKARSRAFHDVHGGRLYASIEELLNDPDVEIVVNLTNPASHHTISKIALLAGKHVYSEKPLAMTFELAAELVAIAQERGLLLSCAPCGYLGESLQTLHDALRRGLIGQPRLIYAELDDGPIHRMHPDSWESPSGIPWPWQDEFRVGCTIEHAGYHIGWMVKIFGPAKFVTADAVRLAPEKHRDLPAPEAAADFSVACIRFASGIVARITCSIIAPHDHALRVIGDNGVLSIGEIWHNGAPVKLHRFTDLSLRAESYSWIARSSGWSRIFGLSGRTLTAGPGGWRRKIRRHEMDYALGIADMSKALKHGTEPVLSAEWSLHVTEIALAIAQACDRGGTVKITSGSR